MQEVFRKLKEKRRQDIELAYPDYSDAVPLMELWVDAFSYGAGAYLAQVQSQQHRIIALESMTFSLAQLNYSTFDKRFSCFKVGQ